MCTGKKVSELLESEEPIFQEGDCSNLLVLNSSNSRPTIQSTLRPSFLHTIPSKVHLTKRPLCCKCVCVLLFCLATLFCRVEYIGLFSVPESVLTLGVNEYHLFLKLLSDDVEYMFDMLFLASF